MFITETKKVRKRAGVVVHNSKMKSFLLVQSNGKLWGFPKGHMELNEDVKTTALRELQEETGIILNREDLDDFTCIKNKSLYYFYDTTDMVGSVQTNVKDNDVNALCWIKTDCLLQMIESKSLKINCHCSYILKNHFNININIV
jgi:8-oxo-dGTP pyrophosphatase MutT (NUDIX family)